MYDCKPGGITSLRNQVLAPIIQFMSIDLATGKEAIAIENVRPIAQTGTRRHSSLPLTPTLSE